MAATQLQSRFLSLPIELIIGTISHLSDDRKSLCALALTCRLAQPLCEEQIYATIELLSTDDLQAVCYAFAHRPQRVEAVNRLKILYKYHKQLAATVEEREAFNCCVRKMKALKEWHIESPFDNMGKWEEIAGNTWVERDMEHFRQSLESASLHPHQPLQTDVGLAKLEKLIIHSHGPGIDFWELGGFHCLFRHPSLRYLHASCFTLPLDLPQLEPFAGTTPLTTLIFDECELECDSLYRILRTPKSLKHLTLGENVANIRRSRGPAPKLTTSPEAAMQALMPVAHSLETLIHYDPTFQTLPDAEKPPPLRMKAPGMRDFHRLKFLECDRCSFLHQGIILSHRLAPPNLETLRLRHYRRQQWANMFDELFDPTPYTYIPSLKTLELAQPEVVRVSTEAFSLAAYICDAERLRERHAFAYKLWKSGITTVMYAELQNSGTLIPPYLHGEPLPQLVSVYDSENIGFTRQIGDDDNDNGDFEFGRKDGLVSSQESSLDTQKSGRPVLPTLLPDRTLPSKPTLETNHLSNDDISRIRNEVWRTFQRYRGPSPVDDFELWIAGVMEDAHEDFFGIDEMQGDVDVEDMDEDSENDEFEDTDGELEFYEVLGEMEGLSDGLSDEDNDDLD